MTTILAYRDGMYADSRWSEDGAHFATPKLDVVDDLIVGCAGETYPINHFLAQLREGRKLHELEAPVPPGHESKLLEFSGLVLGADNHPRWPGLWYFGERFEGDKVDDIYYAIGSGASAALAALHALRARCEGVSPILCVECAIRVDTYSAPPVQWMRLGEYVLHKEGS